ncbi:hypothetical protein L6260_03745, partial [Candidatus Parcubacteria bacterium]|nr:hypothetical protein [Candidatus Parcubacteria bacterium]
MIPNNFTSKSQEAIQIAQMLANENGQQAVDPIHLLASLVNQEDGIIQAVLAKMQVDVNSISKNIDQILNNLPKSFGFSQANMG